MIQAENREVDVADTPHVVVQKWTESERGRGCRPDGFSLHRTERDRRLFLAAYWDAMPDQAPDEYSRPCGTPYRVRVDQTVLARLDAAAAAGQRGLRFTERDPLPVDGGPDGWRPA